MSGDHGPSITVPAAISFLEQNRKVNLILVGDKAVLTPLLKNELKKRPQYESHISIHHASDVVTMDELPSQALRYKKDSSMRVAINLVKQGTAKACVSAGNTGALMATARFVLKTLPGIKRPAITAAFPTMNKKMTRLLDLGANVDSSPEMLHQFAIMGSTLAKTVDNNPSPTVGLLNIGQEEIKGNTQVKFADELIRNDDSINYIGYIEGDEIFSGEIDVVVCDGFIGNITLKTVEGCSRMISTYIREAYRRNFWAKLSGLFALPTLNIVSKQIDPRRRNGGVLVGLNGIVVKSHGRAGVFSFTSALMEAALEIDKNVVEKIQQHMQATMRSPESE